MRIESGPTTERKIRSTLLLILVAGFSVWFAYDGFVGWPNQNKREFLQQIPTEERAKAMESRVYETVTPEALPAAESALREIGSAAQRAALEKLFGGPPSHENTTGWHWFGRVFRITVMVEDGVPTSVIGRAGQRSETDLLFQKLLAGALGLTAIYLVWFVSRVRSTRLVLDDVGLTYRGLGPIRWEDMKTLDISRFAAKGWVDLHYDDHGTQRKLRLDEYHLAKFDEIIDEICRVKGFENPLPVKETVPATAEQPAESS